MEQEVAQILSQNPIALANPGRSLIASRLYASADEASLDVIRTRASYGRLRVDANSMLFGSSSQFQISPQSLLGTIFVSATVAYNRYVHSSSMWLLNAIQSISYQISGSSTISQIQFSGESLKDFIMAQCRSKEKRDYFFPPSGYINGNASGGTATACFPLSLGFMSSPSDLSAWYFDTATLSSNIVITINWKPSFQVFNAITGQTPVLPSQFSSLYLTCEAVDILSSPFAISNAMALDRNLTYAVPTLYVQTYELPQTVTPGQIFTCNLSALPAGQLTAILVSARADSSKGSPNGSTLINPEGVLWSYANLMYNGVNLIQFNNEQEIQAFANYWSDGGGYRYTITNMTSIASSNAKTWDSETLILALNHAPADVLSTYYKQSSESFGGSTLNFSGAVRLLAGDGSTLNVTGGYILTFTYVFNGLIEVRDRVSSLVL